MAKEVEEEFLTSSMLVEVCKFLNILLPSPSLFPGVHLTKNAYPVTTILKEMSATEYSGKINLDYFKNITLEKLNQYQHGKA